MKRTKRFQLARKEVCGECDRALVIYQMKGTEHYVY